MNMIDVKCLKEIVDCKSFSKAAEKLFLSQQAISIKIKRLENYYGIQLIERKPSIKLTHAGEELLSTYNNIRNCEDELNKKLSNKLSAYYGEISIGMPSNRSAAFASEFIPVFCKKYPNMTINLVEMSSDLLPNAIKSNDIDIALPLITGSNEIPESYLFNCVPLEKEDLYVIIPDSLLRENFTEFFPKCKETFLKGISLVEVSKMPMFLRPASSRLHKEIIDRLAQNGISPFIRVKTFITSSLIDLCYNGYGILFCPPMIVKYMLKSDPKKFETLNIFPINEMAGIRRTIIIYHKNKFISKPIEDSISIIKEIYSNNIF